MKILKVKNKSVHWDCNGTQRLLPVMARRFYKNGYTHVQCNGKVYETSGNENVRWLDDIITIGIPW